MAGHVIRRDRRARQDELPDGPAVVEGTARMVPQGRNHLPLIKKPGYGPIQHVRRGSGEVDELPKEPRFQMADVQHCNWTDTNLAISRTPYLQLAA